MNTTQQAGPRLRDLADLLGTINTQIAKLEAQACSVKAELAAAGLREIAGKKFVATIVVSERNSPDMVAIKKTFGDLDLELPTKSTFVQSVRVAGVKP